MTIFKGLLVKLLILRMLLRMLREWPNPGYAEQSEKGILFPKTRDQKDGIATNAPFHLETRCLSCGAVQAIYMIDLKVHHRYAPKQFLYLNYAAAASEVSICP